MQLLGDSMVAVFGGMNEDIGNGNKSLLLLNDLHILHLKEMHWI
jgi:hypothetical protein